MAYNSGANLTPLYVRGKVLSPEVWKKILPPPLSAKVKWSAPYRLHYFASCQPPRSFRATFLDPFSPPSSLSLSLELARLTGCKSRMDVLLLVCYRCYDHDKLQIMACFISGWLGILILCFGFDYYRQRGLARLPRRQIHNAAQCRQKLSNSAKPYKICIFDHIWVYVRPHIWAVMSWSCIYNSWFECGAVRCLFKRTY